MADWSALAGCSAIQTNKLKSITHLKTIPVDSTMTRASSTSNRHAKAFCRIILFFHPFCENGYDNLSTGRQ
jgi:hypothetical protein